MNDIYKELTKSLYNAVNAQQTVDDELKALRESFEAEISPKKETAKKLSAIANDAKTALTEYARLAHQAGLLDKDGPVTMKNMTSIKIDQVKALAWAKVNMPVAIIESVDEKLLKALADKNPEWATVTVEPKPFVASDLGKFVGE